jgi:hypothetical protein
LTDRIASQGAYGRMAAWPVDIARHVIVASGMQHFGWLMLSGQLS